MDVIPDLQLWLVSGDILKSGGGVGKFYDTLYIYFWVINMNPSSKTAQTQPSLSNDVQNIEIQQVIKASRRQTDTLLAQGITLSLERADVITFSRFFRLLRTVKVEFEQFSRTDSYL